MDAEESNPPPTIAVPVLAYHEPEPGDVPVLRWPLWLTIPAAISPFVSFVRGFAPLDVAIKSWPRRGLGFDWDTLGRPLFCWMFLLWPILLAWRVMSYRAGARPAARSNAWRTVAFSVGGLGSLAVIVMMVLVVPDLWRWGSRYWIPLAVALGAVAFAAVVGMASWARRVPVDVRATALIAAPIFVHSALALAATVDERPSVGWWLVLPAAVGLAVELWWYGFTARPRGAAGPAPGQ